jgi:hypothetical protein
LSCIGVKLGLMRTAAKEKIWNEEEESGGKLEETA